MRKLIFTSLIDATINRIGSFFANVFLRRMATHVAANEALDIAAIEERIEQLQGEGRSVAANRLSVHLEELTGDDPTQIMTTSFGQQLLADSFEPEAVPSLSDSTAGDDRPQKRGRPRSKRNGRIAQAGE